MKKPTVSALCRDFLSVWSVTLPAAVLTVIAALLFTAAFAQYPLTFTDALLSILSALTAFVTAAAVSFAVFFLCRKKCAPPPEKARFRIAEPLGIRLRLIVLTFFTTLFFSFGNLLTAELNIPEFRKGSLFMEDAFYKHLVWFALILLLGYTVCAVRIAAGGYTRTVLWTTVVCDIAAVGIICYLCAGVERLFGKLFSYGFNYQLVLFRSVDFALPLCIAILYTADILIVLYKIYGCCDDSFLFIKRLPDLQMLCGLLLSIVPFAVFSAPIAIIHEAYVTHREYELETVQICRTALTVLAVFVVGTVLLFFILKLFIRFTKQPSRIAPFCRFERFENHFRIVLLTAFAVIFFAAEWLLMIYIAAYEVRVRLLNPGAPEKWQPIFAVIFLLGFIVAILRKLEGGYTRRLMRTTVLCDTAALALCLYVFLSPYDFSRVIEVYSWFLEHHPLLAYPLKYLDKVAAGFSCLYYGLDIFDTVWSLPRKKA